MNTTACSQTGCSGWAPAPELFPCGAPAAATSPPAFVNKPHPFSNAYLISFLLNLTHTTEMLAHHRDLCDNPAKFETYGAVETVRISLLAERYLIVAEDFLPQDEPTLNQQLANPREALLGLCKRFNDQDNSNHCIRLLALQPGHLIFASPAFPHGSLGTVALVDFFTKWDVTVKKLRPR